MLLILLLHLSYLGTGLAIMRLIFKNEEYPILFRFTIAYFVGIFAHVIVIHFSIVATVTSPLICWGLFFAGMTGLIYEIILVIKRKAKSFNYTFKLPKNFILNLSIIILLIPVVYLITLKLVCLPDVTYDSTAFWNLKAKYLFYGENFWSDAFMNTNRAHPHQGYPLYMPVVIFEHFSIIGVTDDWLTKCGTWIFYTSGMILFFLLIRQMTNSTIVLLLIVFMLYSPFYSYKSIQGSITNTYVDFPLSLMIAISAGLFIRYQFNRNPLDFFSASVFVASSILLKREGTIWFFLFFTITLLDMVFTRKKHCQNEYAWLILPIFVFICWKLISAKLPPELDITIPIFDQIFNLIHVFPKIFGAWISSIFVFRLWGLFPIFVISYFVIGFSKNLRNPTVLITAFMVLGYLGAIFLILMLTDIQTMNFDYYMRVTYDRLIIQIVPVSLMVTISMNSNKVINRSVNRLN